MTLNRTGIVLAVSVVGILYALVIENPKVNTRKVF